MKGLEEMLGKPKSKPSMPAESSDDDDAMQDFHDASEAGDVKAMALAMKRFVASCGGYEDSDDEE